MSAPRDFDHFYSTTLQPLLAELEAIRTKALKNSFTAFCVVAAIALVVCLAAEIAAFIMIAAISIAAGGAAAYLASASALKTLKTHYKGRVVRALVAFASDGALVYDPFKGLAESVFRAPRLSGSYDRYSSEDFISGRVEQTALAFAEVHTEEKVKTKNGHYWRTVFKGRMVIADFNKHFTNAVFVLPDRMQGVLGSFAQTLQKLTAVRAPLVKLEDPEFEKYFAVYSHDQIEARYILTPDMMQRLSRLRAFHGDGFCCAFLGGSLYLLIPSSRDLFEAPSFFATFHDKAHHRQICRDVEEIIALIHALNLNTRIWTKK